jgi:hypothetical protein
MNLYYSRKAAPIQKYFGHLDIYFNFPLWRDVTLSVCLDVYPFKVLDYFNDQFHINL